jgi:hypothetical protein
MRLIAIFVLFRMMVVLPLHADIGSITELRGVGQVVRDKPYDTSLDFDIEQMDDVRTANGRIGITFIDNSIVRLTEHSKLIIDKVIFDPNPSKSQMSLKFASGTARFITGGIGKINKNNIKIETPTAQIAIRGTDFTVTVDELGRSLVILLPDTNTGLPSGEIVVATAMGEVILNKPYESTVTSMWESTPTSPMILDLTLDIIDNMLIVSPPKNEEEEIAGQVGNDDSDDNILDVDYLAYDGLDIDYLEEDLSFNELDIDYLDVNFLEDLLEVIEELDALAIKETRGAQAFSEIDVQGTLFGQDPSTQILTFGDAEKITIIRSVVQSVQLDLNGETSYNIIIEQDGKNYNIILNSGDNSSIRIRQSSG